jgi:hypothetical protein
MSQSGGGSPLRLAHGWRLARPASASPEEIRDFIRPAVRAIPRSIVRRLNPCTIFLAERLEGSRVASRWTETDHALEIHAASAGVSPHDLALELLRCVCQALWERLNFQEEADWLRRLQAEWDAGVAGEIDEEAFQKKRRLLRKGQGPPGPRRVRIYLREAFAGSAAEYVHALWHDVTIRSGPEHLPARWLRRRLQLLSAWFPPDRGYRLFPGPARPCRPAADELA